MMRSRTSVRCPVFAAASQGERCGSDRVLAGVMAISTGGLDIVLVDLNCAGTTSDLEGLDLLLHPGWTRYVVLCLGVKLRAGDAAGLRFRPKPGKNDGTRTQVGWAAPCPQGSYRSRTGPARCQLAGSVAASPLCCGAAGNRQGASTPILCNENSSGAGVVRRCTSRPASAPWSRSTQEDCRKIVRERPCSPVKGASRCQDRSRRTVQLAIQAPSSDEIASLHSGNPACCRVWKQASWSGWARRAQGGHPHPLGDQRRSGKGRPGASQDV
jgi:hypothetical protein